MIHLRMKLRDWLYEVKYAWQRVVRGYDDTKVMSVDFGFMDTYIEILKQYRLNCEGHPHEMTYGEWMSVLSKMIGHLELARDGNLKRIDRARHKDEFFILFSKHFHNLW